MKIALGADHAGYELKNRLAEVLRAEGHEVTDLGTQGPPSVDYPDFAHAGATLVEQGIVERLVLVCGTGVGMAMTANRHPGVRAVNCSDILTARLSRAHNNANVLALGARIVGVGLAEAIVREWLATPFDGGRHTGRVTKIEASG